MASSILTSSNRARIISIRPESVAGTDLTQQHGYSGPDHDGYRLRGRVAEFNRTSEALDLWEATLDLDSLPTQTRKYRFGKRALDLMLAVVISPALAFLLAAIGALIALTSDGPIFYRQRRIGQHGREFPIWKFRTMHSHADLILIDHLKHSEDAREEWRTRISFGTIPESPSLGAGCAGRAWMSFRRF